MRYKVYAKHKRATLAPICGLAIPNGFFHVIDYKFGPVQRQIENLKAAKNLNEVIIEETDLEPGAYMEDGRAVDYTSLHDHCMSMGEKPVRYIEQPVTQKPQEVPEPAVITELKASLDEKGIAYRKNASEKALRGLLEAS